MLLALALCAGGGPAAAAPCDPPVANPIVCENTKPGNPPAEWDLAGAGDPSIIGYATDISVDHGETVHFKIATDAAAYQIVIYRLGYYGGLGARQVASILPSAPLPQTQPSPITDGATGLVDCGNWAESASWAVPADAVSGVYVAKLIRSDTQGANHIVFVVRDDAGQSPLLFKTGDGTWQAYNTYGGNSLYSGSASSPPVGRAHKVSYNRPFITRDNSTEDWVFNAEYPMIRWLESTGYDVSYTTDVDTDRRGNLLTQHAVFMSVGHDEYWSAGERASVEAARAAGVSLAFFSGNEIYWKVRWEPSVDGSGTPYRTMVCYKEGTQGENTCGSKCDPLPNVWTGLWRAGCEFPTADGCRPENALSGNISWVGSTGAIQVPATYSAMRFWRNTSIATLGPGETATLSDNTLGYEWDFQQFDGFYPAGRLRLSSTTLGGQTHHLSLYRHASGALVFGAGTVQWSWGLDGTHDRGGSTPDVRMQQATVNLFADMGVQPGTLQSGLVSATQSTDATAPTSSIDAPLAGSTVQINVPITVSGLATDGESGVVGLVEVSFDGGATWNVANGRETWSIVWTPAAYGTVNLRVRSTDDSGNLEAPGPGITVTVGDNPTGPPDVPVASNDFYQASSGTPLVVAAPGVLGNDTDPNADPLTAVLRTTTTHGTLSLADDGSFVYTATAGFSGSDAFTYRARDPAANLSAPATVTISVDQTCPCTIFAPTTAPESNWESDTNPVEVGVRFRADVDGYVTAIRFYKQTENSGPHTVHLWQSNGTLLATENSTGEGGSGWQEVTLGAPVAITANLVYVASYHSTSGYAQDSQIFTVPIDHPPLHGLQDGVAGPNGVYSYGPSGTFPTQGFQSSNYYVDVSFSNSVGPDVTPPVVIARGPAPGAIGVAAGASVNATFNEPLNPATVNGATFELRDGSNVLVPGAVSYLPVTRTAVLTPSAPLAYSTVYTATLHGGPSGSRIEDVAGNALAADVTWSFTTRSPPPPPPDEGPGGPILVISGASNPFSRYYAELLRNEGFNAFTASDISLVTPSVLAAHDVAIVGDIALTAGQVTMLSDWVNAGGTLVAMRPDKQLAPLLGLTDASGTLANGYLLVNTASSPGLGIVDQTVQFHGTADLYALNGATSVATLYSDASTVTGHPAVTLRQVGPNGGRAMAFTYDLARSIVYTRQGNPAWAGQERDGISPKRSDDLFYGAASGDPQPDWIDLDKVAIPQADEQQRLLANMIEQGNLHRMPLPRFWYFPKGKKAVVIMTGDNHGSGGMEPRFDEYVAESDPGCSVDDWECIRATGYLYVGGPFTNAQAVSYNAQGFEVGIHVNTGCADWDPSTLDANIYVPELQSFADNYPGVPAPSTNRTHCIAWSDWATQAEVEESHGIRLDTNYYFWPPAWVQDRPGMFTGSGMPMRFARLDGSMIDCYQAVTQMTDESGQNLPATIDALLTKALGSEGYYGAFCANMHFDSAPHAGSDAIVAAAKSRGVPVVSAFQMLRWLDGRNAAAYSNLSWAGSTLSFTVTAPPEARNLSSLVPTVAAAGLLTGITRDGVPVSYPTETIKGVTYAMLASPPGQYAATYGVDATPPVISAVVASPHGDGTTTVTWMTDELATSRVDYGPTPSLGINVSNAATVASHTITLTGLATSATYYYRVRSTDAASNEATYPDPPAAPLTFTTPAAPCFVDDLTAQLAAGDVGANAYVSEVGDGEVTLRPATGLEFSGSVLPAGWSSYAWSGGGTTTVAGGKVVVDGTRVDPDPYSASPGTSIEFAATFSAAAFQHAGFGGGNHTPPSEVYNTSPWAMFSTGSSGGSLQARCWNGGAQSNITIPGSWLGSQHRYRIDWRPASVDFWIDGLLVHSELMAIAGPMRPAISDFSPGGGTLESSWLRILPYATSGTFTSRVFDAGTSVTWGSGTWNADVPSGTTLSVSVRGGPTSVPDGSWSAFASLPGSGSPVGATSRYLQYRVDLTTSDPNVAPALQDIAFDCGPGSFTITASAGANGSIAPAGSVSVASGGSQAFTITPNACYQVANVLVDGVSAGAVAGYTFTNVTANHTIAVSYAPIVVASASHVNATCPGEANGSIDLSVTGGTAPYSYVWSTGATSQDVTGLAAGTHTVTVTDAVGCSTDFAVSVGNAGSSTINASVVGGGTITPSGDTSVGCGGSQAYTMNANTGFVLMDVIVDGQSVGAVGSYTFTNVKHGRTIVAVFGQTTSAQEIPHEFALSRVWPNPAASRTAIEFAVAANAEVRLSVIDVAGHEVSVLAKGHYPPGRYQAIWDAAKAHAAPGVYFLRYWTPSFEQIRRIVLTR